MILSLLLTGCSGRKDDGTVTITNVSYDPTREFYEKYNKYSSLTMRASTAKR